MKEIALDERGSWSFDNEFARNLITFGVVHYLVLIIEKIKIVYMTIVMRVKWQMITLVGLR